jgi:DNA-binding transcriptional MerR regulator
MDVHPAAHQPLSVGLKQASALTGLSERSLRYYVASRQLRVCRAGRKLLVPLSSLKEFVETPQHPSPTESQKRKDEAGK